jgi:hypothetical protein
MSKYEYNERCQHFRGPLEELAYTNPVVMNVIQAYARGDIITKEEALSQMVVMLSKDFGSMRDRYLEYLKLQADITKIV